MSVGKKDIWLSIANWRAAHPLGWSLLWLGITLVWCGAVVMLSGCGLDLDALQAGRRAGDGSAAQAHQDGGMPAGDMAAWNPAAQPVATPACKLYGYVLSPTVVACPGVFSQPGDITKQCGTGWALCTSLPIPLDRCSSVPWGFFASAAHGGQLAPLPPANPKLHCDWNGQNSGADERFLFGCGTTAKTVWTGDACGGFTRAVSCGNGQSMYPTTWKCFLGAYNDERDWPDTSNPQTTTDGVLCCKQ